MIIICTYDRISLVINQLYFLCYHARYTVIEAFKTPIKLQRLVQIKEVDSCLALAFNSYYLTPNFSQGAVK
ncbi:TPA: hypothetical protein JBD21_03165 [Legionella pneumophila subsp. pneumophila]|uniref:Uncharacterized protein n=1 Tax=Legionella pneumophila subsp. pneumophila TaxID=91891 RepID=A0A3A6UKY5_LEGPN|nr:hypothetical protein C3929_06815 [Legionella pneumophila]RJY26943.1 hypothetical protein D1I00_11965 [Legionella pneumophila subsp. pneumophila]PYB49324.1 hypothetical protein DM453_03200 [Legionella pneumophila]PYB67007.1 hypothetical protein DMC17_03200 [Legionella pneumophila]RJY29061.1 hypothetical protein D1H99_08220 [Legionella pneumophila subsp. pneumophila]